MLALGDSGDFNNISDVPIFAELCNCICAWHAAPACQNASCCKSQFFGAPWKVKHTAVCGHRVRLLVCDQVLATYSFVGFS